LVEIWTDYGTSITLTKHFLIKWSHIAIHVVIDLRSKLASDGRGVHIANVKKYFLTWSTLTILDNGLMSRSPGHKKFWYCVIVYCGVGVIKPSHLQRGSDLSPFAAIFWRGWSKTHQIKLKSSNCCLFLRLTVNSYNLVSTLKTNKPTLKLYVPVAYVTDASTFLLHIFQSFLSVNCTTIQVRPQRKIWNHKSLYKASYRIWCHISKYLLFFQIYETNGGCIIPRYIQ
jgi:hypothetical protein